MDFNKHYDLVDKHAFLGASKFHWLKYDDQKLVDTFMSNQAKERGTRLHALACEHILLGIKMPRTSQALNAFVNDAIGFKMIPEQVLYYSPYCFGTADAISFRKEKGIDTLRIHDYKSGVTKTHMEQLMIYAALFCLEYGYDPHDIFIELRIYQFNDHVTCNPDSEDIFNIMEKIVHDNKILATL